MCDGNVALSAVFLVKSKFMLCSSRICSKSSAKKKLAKKIRLKSIERCVVHNVWFKAIVGGMISVYACWKWYVDKDGCVSTSLCVVSGRSCC